MKHFITIGLMMCGLCACTTMGKVVDVVMDPDIQVGSNAEQPTMVGFTFLAESDVNPNGSGEAAPIEFQVVMLAEDSKLLASDYDQLGHDLKDALGKNYLDHQDYTLLPGQFKYLSPVKLDEKTRYIGVIARYAEPDAAEWRKVVRVKSMGENYQILLHLRQNEVQLQKEEE